MQRWYNIQEQHSEGIWYMWKKTIFPWSPELLCLCWPMLFISLCDTSHTYIGKTSRHLATRVKEHSTKPSTIKDHLITYRTYQQHYSCAKSVSVMGSRKNDYEITKEAIKEAILIKSHKPILNKQFATNGTSFMLNIC